MTGIAVAVLPESGAPQVGITVTGLDAAASSVISIDTSWDGGSTWSPVRGATLLSAISGAFVRDYVPALNVPATYRLTIISGAVTPDTLQASITVASDHGWIQDPLNPRGAVPVDGNRSADALLLIHPTASEIVRRQPSDVVVVEGSAYPVASVGRRQAPSAVPFVIRAIPSVHAELVVALRDLLAASGVLVVRGLPAEVPIDPVVHIIAGDVSEIPVHGNVLGLRNDWQLTAVVVRPSSNRVVVPWWSYNQVFGIWSPATYNDVKAARPTDSYLDWVRSPEKPA